MFGEEILNAFSGGYQVSEPGVDTLFGFPPVSNLRKIIAFPVSLSIDSLVRKDDKVVWKGVNIVELPYKNSKLTNDWYDPIKLMINIAIQRGWDSAPHILADEALSFQSALGHYSAFVDLLVQSFSLVNDITLSTAEFVQISGEIQDKIRGRHYPYETVARQQGKEGNVLLYDGATNSYRNEQISFEPFSMFLISENSLAPNQSFMNFQQNFKRFNDGNMMSRDPSSLAYPYVGIRNHLIAEEEMFGRAMESFESNDVRSFVEIISQYSQSLGYNLGVLSEFQRRMAKLLEKYRVKTFVFNVGEYSGSVVVFADSLELTKIKDNTIREYYNQTNKTIRFDELQLSSGSTKNQLRS